MAQNKPQHVTSQDGRERVENNTDSQFNETTQEVHKYRTRQHTGSKHLMKTQLSQNRNHTKLDLEAFSRFAVLIVFSGKCASWFL